jgi:hypothetical protein
MGSWTRVFIMMLAALLAALPAAQEADLAKRLLQAAE